MALPWMAAARVCSKTHLLETIMETNLSSIELLRYPRTVHLEGSRLQGDDEHNFQSLAGLKGAYAVLEEKLDGANSGVSFTEGAELLLQSRGHYLQGGSREKQFALLHRWAQAHEDRLLERLEDRYVMYGEWCYSKHSVYYDALPHYFHEFDLWDRVEKRFLSTRRRRELLAGSPVLSVPVLYEGEMPTDPKLLWKLVAPALAKTATWKENFESAVAKQGLPLDLCWKQTDKDDRAEGLYVKIEDEDTVLARFKLVRANFTQTILDSGSHHQRRPIIPNGLIEGVDLYSETPLVTWEDLGLKTVRGLDELAAWKPHGLQGGVR
jgi:RNA ligase